MLSAVCAEQLHLLPTMVPVLRGCRTTMPERQGENKSNISGILPAIVRILVSAVLTTTIFNFARRVGFFFHPSLLFLHLFHPSQYSGPVEENRQL